MCELRLFHNRLRTADPRAPREPRHADPRIKADEGFSNPVISGKKWLCYLDFQAFVGAELGIQIQASQASFPDTPAWGSRFSPGLA